MSFKEVEEGDEQGRVGGALAKFESPDSGQVEEALRPSWIAERCGQRSKAEGNRVVWTFVVHGLGFIEEERDAFGQDPDR
jgi:hypothetical protein